jgi:nucleotide-binding universal stress UspA family protein
MHRHILLPTDGSELSARAVDYGIALAKAVGAKVTGVTVSDLDHQATARGGAASDAREKPTAAMAADPLAQIVASAAQAGVSCEVVHVEGERPYQAIIDIAKSRGCDLIVMASQGRGALSAAVLGSQTLKVLTNSTIPVLVFRGEGSALFPSYFAAS